MDTVTIVCFVMMAVPILSIIGLEALLAFEKRQEKREKPKEQKLSLRPVPPMPIPPPPPKGKKLMNGLELLLQLEEPVSAYKSGGTIGVEYKGSAILIDGHPQHIHGSGVTIERACMDYARKISGKTLVFRDCTEDRREVNVFFVFQGENGGGKTP